MNPEGAVGEHACCPNCGGMSFELFEDILDVDGAITVIEICLTCSALVNRVSLERLQKDEKALHQAQVLELREVYPVSAHEVAFGATLAEEIPHFLKTLDFFMSKSGITQPAKQLVSAEIGIGRGTLLRAAAQMFGKAYGTDIDFELFEGTRADLPVPDNMILIESISHLPEPVDLMLAWHTLEHIPRLTDVIATMRLLLKPGGHLFFQVPLYRPENVVESHYTFMNRRSIAVLAELEGFEVVDIWTDHSRHFIASILHKPLN